MKKSDISKKPYQKTSILNRKYIEIIKSKKKCIKFNDLSLDTRIQTSLIEMNYIYLSDIQAMTLPSALLGLDLICQAKSGMGKSLIYIISSIHQINLKSKLVQCIILTPTRELANQVFSQYRLLGKKLNLLKINCIVGGANKLNQIIISLKQSPQILVGTMGRIKSLQNSFDITLQFLKCLIVDECDKVVGNLTLRNDFHEIYLKSCVVKQTMLLSATIPLHLRSVCRLYTKDPLEIYIDDEAKLTLEGVKQYYVVSNLITKNRMLLILLEKIPYSKCIIFVNSIIRSRALNKILNNMNFKTVCIHSKINQYYRFKNIKNFSKKTNILIATNVVSRGLDIEKVDYIINYDEPLPVIGSSETKTDIYLHRIGRAGRFGKKGLSVIFIRDFFNNDLITNLRFRYCVSLKEIIVNCDTKHLIFKNNN